MTMMADVLLEPALSRPSGVISHFPTTNSSEQAWFYVTGTLSAVIPGILLLLRLYTKWRVVHMLDLIDCLALSTPALAISELIKSVGLATLSFVSLVDGRGAFTTLLTSSSALPDRADRRDTIECRQRTWGSPMGCTDA